MDRDFGAEVDAALNRSLERLQSAAAEARDRIDRGADGLSVPHSNGAVSFAPAGDLAPIDFGPEPASHAPVNFDLPDDAFGDDSETFGDADSEGIPFPEDNP